MKKKMTSLFLTVTMVTLLLAGCGQPAESQSSEMLTPPASKPAQSQMQDNQANTD